MSGQSEKTEKPTSQRLKKAREEGRFPVSKGFTIALQFSVLTMALHELGPTMLTTIPEWFRFRLVRAMNLAIPPDEQIYRLLREVSWPLLLSLGVLTFLPLLVAQIVQTKGGIALSQLRPQPSRLFSLERFSSMPGQNASALVEALILGGVIAVVVKIAVWDRRQNLGRIAFMDLSGGVAQSGRLLGDLMWNLTLVLVAWGCIDLFRSRRRFQRQLRMSKQEIREEWRQNEGSPEIKSRIRRLRRDLLRRRMMSEVPKASVVVMNPTHFAVALKYDMATMAAPKVVAKGKNYLALRIRDRALQSRVPVVENKPLAQALYRDVNVGQEIPPHMYRATAEILAYVRKMMSSDGQMGG